MWSQIYRNIIGGDKKMNKSDFTRIEKIIEISNIVLQLKERCDGLERENNFLKKLLLKFEVTK